MTSCQLRLKAAEVLEQRGHTKHTLEDPTGAVCLIGAFNVALIGRSDHPWVNLDSDWRSQFHHIDAAIRSMGFTISEFHSAKSNAIDWNNAPERTAAEVIARLREGCDGAEQTT